MRKIPELQDGETITVTCAETGTRLTFDDPKAFAEFKYQRYMSRYLRTVQAIDDGVGRMLDTLDELDLTENRSEAHTSELQSLMRISYAVFCLNKQTNYK